MRLARFRHEDRELFGLVEGDALTVVDDPMAAGGTGRLERTGEAVPAGAVRLLAPVRPRTVVGMAHNTGEADRQLPAQGFLKPSGSVIGPGEAIPMPAGVGRVDAEGELAVVMGRTARDLAPDDALGAVLGYTLANDVTARDLQESDPLWLTAKGYDGFTPLGPWLVTGIDPADVEITLALNGKRLRAGSTADLARGVREVLAYLTAFMTLRPGDVVLTGAPGQFGPVRPGDVATVSAPGLGELVNPVVARPPRPVS